jgi:superfamily I DNA and RNA helicase
MALLMPPVLMVVLPVKIAGRSGEDVLTIVTEVGHTDIAIVDMDWFKCSETVTPHHALMAGKTGHNGHHVQPHAEVEYPTEPVVVLDHVMRAKVNQMRKVPVLVYHVHNVDILTGNFQTPRRPPTIYK